MAYCPNCGVELDKDALACPLCKTPVARNAEAGAAHPRVAEQFIDPEDREGLSEGERRLILWEVRSVCAAIAAVAVAAVNLLVDHRLSWSLYPLFSLALLWLVATAARFFHGRPGLVAMVAAIGLPLLCLGFNWIDGGPGWAVAIAFPIILVIEAGAALLTWAWHTVKRRGVNLIGTALLVVVGVCLAIEATIDLARGGSVYFFWSAIVGFSLVPVSAFLFYVHYRAGKKSNFRRVFRL
jgi:hypothetical protein